ncbi:MAG: response regulator [Leptospirales bacterium]|nr:response regulator [Leptospirales bacterium]
MLNTMIDAASPQLLVIEDDAALRENLLLALELEGYHAIGAGQGADGLRLARERHPAVALLDLTLPDIDGLEVARELKRGALTRDTLIIVLSGRGGQQDIVAALEIAEDFVRKPFEVQELKARVRSMLRLRAAQDLLRQLNQDLEERVIERSAEILRSNRQLEAELEKRRASEKRILDLNIQLLEVREEERSRLAQEIHDNIGQQIVSLKWMIQAQLAAPSSEGLREALLRFDALARSTRALAHDLGASPLHPRGLEAALLDLARSFSERMEVEMQIEGLEASLTEDQQVHIFRIIQEALSNTARHSQARRTEVHWGLADGALWLAIEDDGGGAPELVFRDGGGGLGLRIMKQRAVAIGAALEVENHGQGLRITIRSRPEREEHPSPAGRRS